LDSFLTSSLSSHLFPTVHRPSKRKKRGRKKKEELLREEEEEERRDGGKMVDEEEEDHDFRLFEKYDICENKNKIRLKSRSPPLIISSYQAMLRLNLLLGDDIRLNEMVDLYNFINICQYRGE